LPKETTLSQVDHAHRARAIIVWFENVSSSHFAICLKRRGNASTEKECDTSLQDDTEETGTWMRIWEINSEGNFSISRNGLDIEYSGKISFQGSYCYHLVDNSHIADVRLMRIIFRFMN